MGMTEDLLKLKKSIEETKTNLSKAEGYVVAEMERLKKDFGIDTIEDAEVLRDSIIAEVEKMEQESKVKFEELKTKFKW
jgi:hypothetical protein